MRIWRIAADTREYEAHDLSGKGAAKEPGRWNKAGSPVVYASDSAALAAYETAVHLRMEGFPANRFLVAIDIPNDVWKSREVLDRLPVGWSAVPEGRVSVEIGEAWLGRCSSALFQVPSVVVPEECNVLINPQHPHALKIVANKIRPWYYDSRLR